MYISNRFNVGDVIYTLDASTDSVRRERVEVVKITVSESGTVVKYMTASASYLQEQAFSYPSEAFDKLEAMKNPPEPLPAPPEPLPAPPEEVNICV